MSKRDWLPYVAVGGIVLIAAIAASYKAAPQCFSLWEESYTEGVKTNDRSKAYDNAARESVDWASAIEKQGIPPIPCPDRADDCTEPYHNALDLKAQWATADAAGTMVCLTVFQILIGLLGFGALIVSLKLTRDALIQSRITSMIENRAWITSSGPRVKCIKTDDGTLYDISFEWRVGGKTPAQSIQCMVGFADGDLFAGGEPRFRGPEATRPDEGPDGNFWTDSIQLTPAQVLETSKAPILIRSAVRYKTIFQQLGFRTSDITVSIKFIGPPDIKRVIEGHFSKEEFEFARIGPNGLT